MPPAQAEVPIRALLPRTRTNHLRGNFVEIWRSFYGIRHRGEENIRIAALYMIHRGKDVAEFLALVAPHEEHSRLNAPRLAQRYRVLHLLHGDAALHRVQDALRTAFRADPHPEAAELGQRVHYFLIQPVGAGDAFEWDQEPAFLCQGRIFIEPPVVNCEHVVGEPGHIWGIAAQQPLQLLRHRSWLSAAMGFAKYLVAAPAAAVSATARGNQRDRSLAMVSAPGLHV